MSKQTCQSLMNVLHLIINNKKTAAINCRTLTIAKCHSANCELTFNLKNCHRKEAIFVLLGNFSPSFLRRNRLISLILRVILKYSPTSRMMDLVVLIQKDFVGRDKCWYSCIKLEKVYKLVDPMISRSLPEVGWVLLYNFMQIQPSQSLLILLLFSSQECTI